MLILCTKCDKPVEIESYKVYKGRGYTDCPECGTALVFARGVDPDKYKNVGGKLIRINPKMKISKADKKRAIREKHQRSAE